MFYKLTKSNVQTYDAEEAYDDAMQKLAVLRGNMPQYDDRHDRAVQSLYQEIVNRPKFSYDAGQDALYQSYKRSYAQQGRLAMEDAMGQAAGLTGGYGSSYAQTVGQQQYGAYLQKLGDVYPELYGMAYQQYLDEGSALQNQYAMLSDRADEAYGRYQDQLAAYYREMDGLQAQADQAYARMTAEEQTAYDRGQDAYDQQQDAYDRLVNMMLTMGYVPDEAELSAAGMSEKEMNAYLGYYNMMAANGGNYRGSNNGGNDDAFDRAMLYARQRLQDADVETVNGEIARMVAAGQLDAETARQVIIALTQEHYG